MKSPNDIARLRDEYESRKQRLAGSDLYSLFNTPNLFMIQQRQRAVLQMLKKNGFADLSNKIILEMGCGNGGVLAEYLQFGAPPKKLFGVDLLFDRLISAHQVLSSSSFVNADGQALPFPAQTFDLILQSTALSSILDSALRQAICADMLRLLTTRGLILSYDFWLNPTNSHTRGIRPAELKKLFPNCEYQFKRITLAPPITRRLATVSWGVCLFLENLKIFNTHYLAAIRPTQ